VWESAAYVPFYPDCMTTYISDTEVADRPIRIFGGTLDDYNPISVCKAYVERLRAAGRDVEVDGIPERGFMHLTILSARSPAAVSPKFESVRNCKIRRRPGGLLINAAKPSSHSPMRTRASCTVHTWAYDPAAAQAAKTSVKAFLKAVLKLE